MKVFVTGATGYIGQAVATKLQLDGHTVSGLTRTAAGAKALLARGVQPVVGALDDEDVLRDAATAVDAVIDTATADHAEATETFLNALRGTDKAYIRTSGTGVYTDLAGGELNPRVYTEDTDFVPAEVVATRVDSDNKVLAAAADGIRTVVLRPSMIYGDGASEQLPLLIRSALTQGRCIYVGSGVNRWSNVYLTDLANAYALALTNAKAGSLYNLAAGEAQLKDIADAIGTVLGLPSESVSLEEGHRILGERWVDVAIASNSRVDSAAARHDLGWEPVGPDIIEELVRGSYKRVWAFKGDPHDHVTKH